MLCEKLGFRELAGQGFDKTQKTKGETAERSGGA
jgi:hypothetical protein